MTYPVKIVGVVVDVHNITMYKADGDTIVIAQGDPRVKELVAKLVPAFDLSGEQFYMLTAEDMMDRNHFAEAEKKMGGVVRFFKMVKSKAKELLDKFVEPVAPMVLGTKEAIKTPPQPIHTVNDEVVEQGEDFPAPVVEEAKPKLPPEEERPLTKSAAAVAEIMANAVPSTSKNFSTPAVPGEEATTVIAVLEDNTVIPGVEMLSQQAQAVSEGIGSSMGMQNFLRRAGMIRRGHSVEDLLKFIEKGELPLADDGCVLVYKLLNRTDEEGVFVDCHSGKVRQGVGSFVHMKESLVDPNRAQDCSNGLHVARRDYLRNFGGDVCVLAKLAPEDVIAVPRYDARKLRAKGYHIIAELSEADRNLVTGNRPMEDQVLLGNAIAGNHVGILEYVEITQQMGGGLVVTPVEGAVTEAPALDESLTGSSLDHLPSEQFDPEKNSVDARALALEVAKPVPVTEQGLPPKPVVKVSKTDELVQAFRKTAGDPVANLAAAKALLDFKKQAKKSWTALGISIDDWEAATQVVEKDVAAASLPKAVPPNDDKRFPVLAGNNDGLPAKPVKVKKAAPPKPTPKAKVKPVETVMKAPVAPKAPGKRSQKEEAAHLLDIYTKNPDFINAKQLVAFKKGTKKGWGAIGIDEALGKKLENRVKV